MTSFVNRKVEIKNWTRVPDDEGLAKDKKHEDLDKEEDKVQAVMNYVKNGNYYNKEIPDEVNPCKKVFPNRVYTVDEKEIFY